MGLAGIQPVALALLFLSITSSPARSSDSTQHLFDVRNHGAVGDGESLDTAAINQTIETCARSGGGQIYFPPGRYLSGTVHLRSHVTLVLSPGSRLIGTTNLNEYHAPSVPEYMPEGSFGKWHRALIVAENAEDLAITGQGVIDGNKVFDPTGEERMRGPHAIAFANCRGFTIRDVTITDAANYAVFFQVSDDVEVRNIKVVGGWDGVHWRGAPERWCRNVRILSSQFYTGDDSLAGRYWEDTLISGCVINSSCNGIRLIGPARRLIVHDCLFYGPGLQPHRTSGPARRTNMLSGIILQPGAWDRTQGPLDDVLISRVTMDKVASPVTLWIRPGNTAGRVRIDDLSATGVYRSALSIESWAETPIANVTIRNARIEFEGGGQSGQAGQPVKNPGVDARPLPAWGVYIRNAERVALEDVRLSVARDDLRPVLKAENTGQLILDQFSFDRIAGVNSPIVTTNVARLVWPGLPESTTSDRR